MTVGISGLIKLIERKLVKFRNPISGMSRREEEQVIELLLLHFICQDPVRKNTLSTKRREGIIKQLRKDLELEEELLFYGDVVFDIISRYFDYLGDGIGYDCEVTYSLRRRKIFIEGRSTCLRRKLSR